MKHIHPFPARMAPEIALEKVQGLGAGKIVLDPMCGSGMVLSQAARNGLFSVGYEMDPLARLLSHVVATRINETQAREALDRLLEVCIGAKKGQESIYLPWIDGDKETRAFIKKWFAEKQEKQLRSLSYYLTVKPVERNRNIVNVLRVALSRLIVSKEPKASLARDTAHSRPHKVMETNDFDVLAELPSSLEHVLRALGSPTIVFNTRSFLGDARKMVQLEDNSVDAIITSPPYLNAIDYLRGHRFSLVWLGYSVPELRSIRASSIGTEVSMNGERDGNFIRMSRVLEVQGLKPRTLRILERYYHDLRVQMSESFRVLKSGASATYVIGNSTLGGYYIRNSELLKSAAQLANFAVRSEVTREIPNHHRYLPIPSMPGGALASRMRTEHIIEVQKPGNVNRIQCISECVPCPFAR